MQKYTDEFLHHHNQLISETLLDLYEFIQDAVIKNDYMYEYDEDYDKDLEKLYQLLGEIVDKNFEKIV